MSGRCWARFSLRLVLECEWPECICSSSYLQSDGKLHAYFIYEWTGVLQCGARQLIFPAELIASFIHKTLGSTDCNNLANFSKLAYSILSQVVLLCFFQRIFKRSNGYQIFRRELCQQQLRPTQTMRMNSVTLSPGDQWIQRFRERHKFSLGTKPISRTNMTAIISHFIKT